MHHEIVLPDGFTPRHYQSDVFKAVFVDGYKRIVLIWPRRHGKDLTSLQIVIGLACQRVGAYYYLFPEQEQVRKAIWEGMDNNGKRFIDYIPKQLLSKPPNNTRMSIELKNGSIIRFGGADRYDALMGTNPVCVVFSEFAIQSPDAWHFIRPILRQNDGHVIMPFTPRGKNHGWEIYRMANEKEDWYCSYLNIEQTKKIDGCNVITNEDIEQERAEGMPEELIQQEYYCSFDVALVGAYYAKEIQKAYDEDRITNKYSIETISPVITSWDLGSTDATAIWFFQKRGQFIHAIHYVEESFAGPDYFADYLNEFAVRNKIKYAKHYLPHDAKSKHFVSNSSSTFSVLQRAGLHNIEVVPVSSIAQGIASVRYFFDRLIFHENECKMGIEAIKSYKSEYVSKDRVFKKTPKHDWSSHCADALRYFCTAYSDNYSYDKAMRVEKYKSYEIRL